MSVKRLLTPFLAPLAALVAAVLITSAVVMMVGASPIDFWDVMLSRPSDRGLVNMVNQASMIFLAAVAAAIGFRMNLFNIGVEGQYRIASYAAAVFAGAAIFSGWLNIIASLIVAMAVGGFWAFIPAILRVTRGVSEVISTIMLNSIAAFLVSYLVLNYGVKVGESRRTEPLEDSSRIGGWQPFTRADGQIWTLGLIAILIGVAYWFVINRTRFGFELRATGASESAAVASGVNVKKMIVVSMVLSGAVAGLIWMPSFFADGSAGSFYSEGAFQGGLGFTGIAVALLGRNSSFGMAVGAFLFAFLSVQASALEFSGVDVSKNIVIVTQGVIVLMIVIAYEVVGRWRAAADQRAVTAALKGAKQEVAA